MRGKFIAFEGGEGCGKSTQARMLADWLTAQGRDAVLTREPGGTPGAEAIRALLLDPPGTGWAARAEALLFAAARSDHVERLIAPALGSGRWVISDRYLDSSRAYQGGAGGLDDHSIMALHEFGSGSLRPDLVFVLQAPEETLSARLAARDGDVSDAIGGRGAEFHRAVAEAFVAIAASDPQKYQRIDGVGSAEDVHKTVLRHLAPLLSECDGAA